MYQSGAAALAVSGSGLTTDRPEDRSGVYSGSALIEDGTMYLFIPEMSNCRVTMTILMKEEFPAS